MENVS
jgi:hypothetical protein